MSELDRTKPTERTIDSKVRVGVDADGVRHEERTIGEARAEVKDLPDPEHPAVEALRFGYKRGLAPGVVTAHGARWIIHQDGGVDQVYDRQDAIGPDDRRHELLDHLNTVVKGQAADRARELLASWDVDGPNQKLGTMDDREVILYEDDRLITKANPQASGGYLYVVSYFKEDAA
jgi:hypothetical protein